MEIDEKIAEGYVILCHNKAEEHVFIVRTLGPAVECPKCGSTALSGDLATDYVRRKRHLANGARQVAVP
jgi:hypothetical protein